MTGSLPPGWPGYLIGLLGVIFPFVMNLWKGNAENNIKVMNEWQKLYDAHEKRIAAYEKRIEGYERRIETITLQFEEHRKEAAEESRLLRHRLSEAEERIRHLERLVIDKEEENAGLKRQLAQITQSTAARLGENYMGPDVAEAAHRASEARRKKRDGE